MSSYLHHRPLRLFIRCYRPGNCSGIVSQASYSGGSGFDCRTVHVLYVVDIMGATDSRFKSKTSTVATLYTWPPDDGLQTGPKRVETW
jgi:hypothetical protein